MPLTVKTLVTAKEHNKFKVSSYEAPALGAYDILIKMKACGLCHSDMMYHEKLPENIVLGHEPVGIVEQLGSEVTKFQKGELVGFAFLKKSCLDCSQCNSGNDFVCPKRVTFPRGNNNGFADAAVVDSRFAYKIPKGLSAKDAAPLMCAGVTVFSSLVQSGVTPIGRVAIVGIGGLGHLALQFARAWGCHVTAISTSPDKKDEALSFGAHEYISSRDFGDFGTREEDKFDVIFNTVSAVLDWDKYLGFLKPNGKFMLIGVPDAAVEIKHTLRVIFEQLAFVGTFQAGRLLTQQMLEFAARHNIKPMIEEFPFSVEGAEAAFERCESNKMRYRGVLVFDD
ncbi:chaperonin 10-like protein [Spinellus fusiger]|nr:chaperonin 10-like protein [Spinellus fusiger]